VGVRVALFIEVDPRKIGRTVRGAPVFGYAEARRARGLPLLVAVGAPGAAAGGEVGLEPAEAVPVDQNARGDYEPM